MITIAECALTKDEVVNSMMYSSRSELSQKCSEAFKREFGFEGRHLLNYSVPELVSWWLNYFEWDIDKQT